MVAVQSGVVAIRKMRILLHLLLLGLLATPINAVAQVIGLRFIVDASLGATPQQRHQIGGRLHQQVEELNGYYVSSKVVLRAQVVDVSFASILSIDAIQILEDMRLERGGFESMFSRANEIGADYTIALATDLTLRGRPSCGRAFAVNKSVAAISTSRTAFLVMGATCKAQTLAHELGHLMGLNHGALIAKCTGNRTHMAAIAPYANGWGQGHCDGVPQEGAFGTIMVGGYMKHVDGKNGGLPMFSNPRIEDPRCGPMRRCGDLLLGDSARALNEYAHLYAAHEEPDVHTLAFPSPELKACIVEKYRGVEIVDMKELICPGRGIRTLAGIEQLQALTSIDVSNNAIAEDSLAQLDALTKLATVDLRGNEAMACASLAQLARRQDLKVIAPVRCR